MNQKIFKNGQKIEDPKTVHPLPEETIGIFETMRAYCGRIFRFEEHLERLLDSAKTVGYHPFPDLGRLRLETLHALKASGEKNASVRLTLWEGDVFVMIGARKSSENLYRKGVVLKTASFPRGNPQGFPFQTKVSAYQQAVLASTEPRADKVYEWLFLDNRNYLTETRVGNFFLVRYPSLRSRKKAVLLTPPEYLILNGVTRKFVIKCALEIGYEVQETHLTRHDFFNADEAFLSNTSWEILPVRELDGRRIGVKVPGPVTSKLLHFFRRRIQKDVTSDHSSSSY